MNPVEIGGLFLVFLACFAVGYRWFWRRSTATSVKDASSVGSVPSQDFTAPVVPPPLELLKERLHHARDVGMRHRELAIQSERKALESQQVQTLEHIREHVGWVLIQLERAMELWIRESQVVDCEDINLGDPLHDDSAHARDHVEWLLEITSKTLRHALDICRSPAWEWRDLQPKLTHVAHTLEALHTHNRGAMNERQTTTDSKERLMWKSDWSRISADSIVEGPDMLLDLLNMQQMPESEGRVSPFEASQPSK